LRKILFQFVLKTIAVLISIVGIGSFALRPILRLIASLHIREIFTALALLLVFGMSALMQRLELSIGLGAFIAGVLLAKQTDQKDLIVVAKQARIDLEKMFDSERKLLDSSSDG
jgi:Kef-type K+ transport system membrane component KefB